MLRAGVLQRTHEVRGQQIMQRSAMPPSPQEQYGFDKLRRETHGQRIKIKEYVRLFIFLFIYIIIPVRHKSTSFRRTRREILKLDSLLCMVSAVIDWFSFHWVKIQVE
jgi:hypothetical protein